MALCCPLVGGADSAPSEPGDLSLAAPHSPPSPSALTHPQQAETVAAGPRKDVMAKRHGAVATSPSQGDCAHGHV